MHISQTFVLEISLLELSLHKISYARQFENKFSLLSLALSLHKISCARQFENKFSLLSLALSLHKISCARQFENKFSLLSLALSLHKSNKMIRLNLPSFEIKLSGTQQHPTIFDILRRKHVALTPEEWVRQHFIHFLIEHKNYPAALMANEVSLYSGNKQLRADSVVYDRCLKPRMIMEYKAPTVTITRNVFNQIAAYNVLLHVDYLVVSNGLQHYCCKTDYRTSSFAFLKEIPDYCELK